MTNEEAKRRMEICRDFLANNYSDMGEPNFTAFNMAIKALEQQRWIPVNKPPKETGEYIVTIRWQNHYRYGDCKYSVVKRKYYADVKTWEDSLVIAYMPKPLPEPFREEDKDEN